MKQTHWYLRGWQYEPRIDQDGSTAQELVYKGEYYRLRTGPLRLRTLKLCFCGLTAVLWAVLLVLLTHMSRGAMLFFVGGACGVTLIPALYLTMGCIGLVRGGEYLTYRDLRSSVYRLKHSSGWISVLMGICLAGECFFLIYRGVNHYAIAWGSELRWLLGSLIGTAVAVVSLYLLRRYPAEICPEHEVKLNH